MQLVFNVARSMLSMRLTEQFSETISLLVHYAKLPEIALKSQSTISPAADASRLREHTSMVFSRNRSACRSRAKSPDFQRQFKVLKTLKFVR